MKSTFEKELTKQGFLIQEISDGYYKITPKSRIVLPTLVKLVISKPINLIIHGSQNGNELDAIGYFHFNLNSEHPPNYLVFAFKHLRNDTTQYMIIPTEELRERLKRNRIRYMSGKCFTYRLWLMDSKLYDTTNLGLEGEWYYLSKGRGGRMIDGTFWDFTGFLNNWVLGSGE
jgi:hypothetical protein